MKKTTIQINNQILLKFCSIFNALICHKSAHIIKIYIYPIIKKLIKSLIQLIIILKMKKINKSWSEIISHKCKNTPFNLFSVKMINI